MIKEISPHMISDRPSCLLIGNGINRRFYDESWEQIIKKELINSKQNCTYEEIRDMPATMQIVVATRDNVANRMKDLSERLMDLNMSEERVQFLQELLGLPVDDILTANYSFEMEAASGMPLSKKIYSRALKSSFDLENKHKQFRLFQYYESEKQKRIWHIHGDAAKPDTMLMGHYYYAKQLRAIQDCVPKTVRRYQICQKNGEPFQPYSWVDQFLTGDVYVLGLGMYMCEADLWYLACCKKRNFPETKTYFYDLAINDLCKQKLLEAYNIEIIDGTILGATSYETDFYPKAMNHVHNKIEERKS